MLMKETRVKSVSGIMLTGEDRSTMSKTHASAISFATNPIRTDRRLNLRLRGKKVTSNRLTNGSTPSQNVRF